jgi:hypothetical protein
MRRARGSRALSCFWQAVLCLGWYRARIAADALARDHDISRAIAYCYLDEVIIVLTARLPGQQVVINGNALSPLPFSPSRL